MNNESVEELFSVAAKRETEAHEFYSSAAKKMKDRGVKDMFAQLAKDEMGHFELIEAFRRDPTSLMKISAPDSDWKLAESEKLPKLSTNMKPKDAVALAMKKEQMAVEFYRKLSKSTEDAGARDMLVNLANMELNHKRKLEMMFADIGYPEVF